MSKIMPLELLSSIKGAKSSKDVDELFKTIKKAHPGKGVELIFDPATSTVVTIDHLRNDTVKACSEQEKKLIKENFPKEKNGFLVVSKVIDD